MTVKTVRGHSPGGEWVYAEWRPAALARWVDRLWAFRGPTADRFKRVFPNGCVELLLNFAEPYRFAGDGSILDGAWISGPASSALVVEQPPFQDCMAARLRPAGARALAARPMSELAEPSIQLAELVGREAGELRERCAEAGLEPRLRLLAEWLRARIERSAGSTPAGEPVASWVLGELVASRGAAPIATLRREAGFSKRRMLTTFRDHVGLTPKRYARILRFHHALRVLQDAPADKRLVELAHDAFFYDQPHMNAEFRALGGVTPSQFLRARHPVGDGSTAADR